MARRSFPDKVIELEEQWGDHLCETGRHEAAISHYLESGHSEKAVDAAISAREWTKAMEILEIMERSPTTTQYYAKIAEHFEAEGEYDVCHLFIKI